MALVKLKIGAYADPACLNDQIGSTFEVMFNPDKYSRDYAVKYEESQVLGENDTTLIFKGMSGGGMVLNLKADGTGVVKLPEGISNVDAYVEKVKSLVYTFHGDDHRPPYLKIEWGTLTTISVCTALKINYTLFKPDGTALRADIDITLSATTDFKTKAKEAKKNSPDLTHVRTVKAGDNLPLMTYRIYGDSSYYLEVAKANGLANISSIKPGDVIYFPPIKK